MTVREPVSRVIDIATPEWCWSRLSGTSEGCLSYRTERRQTNLAVLYALDGHQITIPIAAYNETGYLADHAEVTLEVNGSTVDGMVWTVRASGRANLQPSDRPGVDASRRGHPAYGEESSTDILNIPVVRIRGFYETSLRTTDIPAIARPGLEGRFSRGRER
jgi:hypothetical protein